MTDKTPSTITPRTLADFTRVCDQTGILSGDPNEAYTIIPTVPEPHGPPAHWWTVLHHGEPTRYCPTREAAERYATDPVYRARIAADEVPLHERNPWL